MPELPDFIRPMLARSGDAFDSDEHLFEVKWDGTRTLAFRDGTGLWMRNRNQRDSLLRYPELGFLESLPAGTVLDGEVCILREGRPDFRLMVKREQAPNLERARRLAQLHPATYVVFDLLYADHRSLLGEPLETRRQALAELVPRLPDPRLVLSQGVVGSGVLFLEEVVKLELEGMVAKRLTSTYQPGRRSDAWTKVKLTHQLLCVILGYSADDSGSVRSLVIATDGDEGLCCVGRVGSGLDARTSEKLGELCRERPRERALIECDLDAQWIEPGLYCTVSYLERTESGYLRAPVFQELIIDPE